MLRLRPSSWVSRARVVGPWWCTQVSRALVLTRLSSSWLIPVFVGMIGLPSPGQTRPEAAALRRLIASTEAASSSTAPVIM